MGELRQSEIPVPDSFCCPITKEVMEDPVCTCDGHSYERAAIELWLRRRRTSPSTGMALPSLSLTPNIGLKKSIQAFREQRPEVERSQLQQRDLELAMQVREQDWAGKVDEQGAQVARLLAHIAALEQQVRSLGAEPAAAPAEEEQPLPASGSSMQPMSASAPSRSSMQPMPASDEVQAPAPTPAPVPAAVSTCSAETPGTSPFQQRARETAAAAAEARRSAAPADLAAPVAEAEPPSTEVADSPGSGRSRTTTYRPPGPSVVAPPAAATASSSNHHAAAADGDEAIRTICEVAGCSATEALEALRLHGSRSDAVAHILDQREQRELRERSQQRELLAQREQRQAAGPGSGRGSDAAPVAQGAAQVTAQTLDSVRQEQAVVQGALLQLQRHPALSGSEPAQALNALNSRLEELQALAAAR